MPSSVGLGQQATQTFQALGTANPPTLGSPTGSPLTGIATTGPGQVLVVDGFNGAQMVELVELNIGAATVRIQGSHDGLAWYTVGYQRVDNTLTLARAVADFALAQNNSAILQLLDAYPLIRLNLVTNTGRVFARLYGVPG